jgi:hypothetical protein
MAQVVEQHLPNKCKSLSLNSSADKTKEVSELGLTNFMLQMRTLRL